MGKSAHHKKLRRQEKAKVKLKVGKKLPKGQNVTDTSFKTRKIILHEQLKTTTSEPVTKRKLNLKTLLSYLKHYSVKVRRDSLIGLKELLMQNPELITVNLAAIIGRVSELIVDIEGKIRKLALGLLELVLRQVSQQQLTPFFPVLSAHLCCAMTHITPAVQQHSLLLVDALLATFPTFITAAASHILPNFLNQISRKISDNSTRAVTTCSTRLLVVNIEEKITDLKWKTNVLKKLHKFLKVLIQDSETESLASGDCKVNWSNTVETYVPLYAFSGCAPTVLEGLTLNREEMWKSSEAGYFLKESSQVKDFVTCLMPLLIETWVEASPATRGKYKPGNILSSDGVEVLDCVLEIIQLLWKLICNWEMEEKQCLLSPWFIATYHTDIIQNFLQCFPFTQCPEKKGMKRKHESDARKREDKENLSNTGMKLKCENQNLAICSIFSFIATDQDTEHAGKVMKYVVEVLEDSTDAVDCRKMIHVLEEILLHANSIAFTDCSVTADEVLTAAVQRFKQLHPLKMERALLIHLLTGIVLNDNLHHLHRLQSLTTWLTYLPDLLCEEDIPAIALRVMQRVACQKNPLFLQSFKKKMPTVIEKFPHIKAVGTGKVEAQKALLDIIYQLPEWSPDTVETLKMYCEEDQVPAGTAAYVRNLLKARMIWSVAPSVAGRRKKGK